MTMAKATPNMARMKNRMNGCTVDHPLLPGCGSGLFFGAVGDFLVFKISVSFNTRLNLDPVGSSGRAAGRAAGINPAGNAPHSTPAGQFFLDLRAAICY